MNNSWRRVNSDEMVNINFSVTITMIAIFFKHLAASSFLRSVRENEVFQPPGDRVRRNLLPLPNTGFPSDSIQSFDLISIIAFHPLWNNCITQAQKIARPTGS